MFKQIWQKRLVWGKVLIVGLVVLAIAASVYTGTAAGQVSDQETLVLGQTEFSPGAPAALRVVVRDFKTAQPVANATVAVKMRPQAGGDDYCSSAAIIWEIACGGDVRSV